MRFLFCRPPVMAQRSFPGPEWRNWTLGVQLTSISHSPDSPFSIVFPQVPSPLHSRAKSHRFLVWRNSVPHHAWNHRPNDANPPRWLCITFQPWNSLRIIPEDYFPSKSSNIWAFPPTIHSIPCYKSPLSFFHVFDQRKPNHLVPMSLVGILFESVGRWTHSGIFIHFLHWW